MQPRFIHATKATVQVCHLCEEMVEWEQDEKWAKFPVPTSWAINFVTEMSRVVVIYGEKRLKWNTRDKRQVASLLSTTK